MKKILPIILGLVLAGAGFGIYTMFLSGGGAKESPAKAQAAKQKVAVKDKKGRVKDGIVGPIVSAGDPLTVNLSDPDLAHFLKASVWLRVDATTPLSAVAGTDPTLLEKAEVRDILISVLTQHSSRELTTPEGRDAVKRQIIKAIDAGTEQTVALDVYFTDFAIQ